MHLCVKAQQDPIFTQNMHNHMSHNPAFAGERNSWVVSGIYRNQWTKMTDAPEIYVVNVDAPFLIKGRTHGFAINLTDDKLGMQKNMHLMMNYSFKCQLNWGVLSMGAKLGIIATSIEGEFRIPEGDGFVQPGQDPALASADISKNMFDVGVGLFLTGKNFYSGLSVSHLSKPTFHLGTAGDYFWNRHMTFTAGYTWKLSSKIDIQPSLFLNSDFKTNQYLVNANMIYDSRFWGGLSYRYKSSISFMGGLEISEGLALGYSYDLNTSGISRYVGGVHEITCSYAFGLNFGKKEKIYKSIRFL